MKMSDWSKYVGASFFGAVVMALTWLVIRQDKGPVPKYARTPTPTLHVQVCDQIDPQLVAKAVETCPVDIETTTVHDCSLSSTLVTLLAPTDDLDERGLTELYFSTVEGVTYVQDQGDGKPGPTQVGVISGALVMVASNASSDLIAHELCHAAGYLHAPWPGHLMSRTIEPRPDTRWMPFGAHEAMALGD